MGSYFLCYIVFPFLLDHSWQCLKYSCRCVGILRSRCTPDILLPGQKVQGLSVACSISRRNHLRRWPQPCRCILGVPPQRLPPPVSDDSPSTLDHGHQGQIVIRLQVSFHHQIAVPRRQQAVGVTITPVQRYPDAIPDALERLPRGAFEHMGRGGIHVRRADLGTCSSGYRCAIQIGGLPRHAQPPLFENGLVNDAEDGGSVV